MKSKTIKLLVVILLVLPLCVVMLGSGCEKNEESEKFQGNGLILFLGNPAVDGCGWMVQIDSTLYSPINLDSEFKKDSLEVLLNYCIIDSLWRCGWREPGYQMIELEKVIIEN